MNSNSPGDQASVASPLLQAPPLQTYQQAPSLTPPVSAPAVEAEVPFLSSEEGLFPQPPAPLAVESSVMEEPALNAEDSSTPMMAPAPLPAPVLPPESEEIAEPTEMVPATVAPVEAGQVEPVPENVEAVCETPSGKRARTKKPKSAAKASKSKAKKEPDSWMDGEALSSAGADTNDEVTFSFQVKFILDTAYLFLN